MKVDVKYIAELLAYKGRRSNSINIEDEIQEFILIEMKAHLDKLTDEVIAEMQELEHPAPRNREEYNERYGLDKE